MTARYQNARRGFLRLLALGSGSALAGCGILAEGKPPVRKPDGVTLLKVEELIGLQLRVVEPGQMVTMEYRADRATIHLDAKGRIARVLRD
jgi:hypothetical protein